MRSKLLHTLCACLVSCTLNAATVSADSLHYAAQDEDFVRASLITIGPGNEVYSLYGHSAIRMQCPANQLDYCFTFEMALKPEEKLKFMFSTAKAGFIAARTETFFGNYMAQGRSITEQQLNLRPAEEQNLWQMLDQEMKEGAHWNYSFLTTNCSSMCIWIIQKALSTEGEIIEYGKLPEPVLGTYRDLLNYISADAPWAHLFWNLRMGSEGSKQGKIADKLAPALLLEAWADAVIKDPAGMTRPIFAGAPIYVAPQTLLIKPTIITPMVALIIAIILIIIIVIFIKTKCMKRLFTSSKRLMLTTALVLTSVLSAMAGGEDWYAYNVQVDAYPTGAGLVYVDTVEVYDDIDYKESWNREFVTKLTSANGYAVANDGWYFLGFAKDSIDENGNVHHIDRIAATVDEWTGCAMLSLDGLKSSHYDEASQSEVSDDSLTVASKMPLEPNNYFRAIFTHAYANVAPGYEYLGKVTVDKLANKIGDKVTFTATPLCSFTTFVNWTKDGEVVSTNPTLEVTVGGVEEYIANFTDSRNLTIKFPEEGGYVPFYSKYSYGLSNTDVYAYAPVVYDGYENNCLVDEMNGEQRISFLNMISGNYQTGGTPQLLYGYGEVELVPNDTTEAGESYDIQLFKWAGESGIAVDGLDQSQEKYYVYDQADLKFNLITSGSIAANSLYMVMPDSLMAEGQAAPAVIYISEEVITGIANTIVKKADRKNIYDLQGRRVDAMNREGIYVFDGKKVIYRKK